MYLKQFTQIAQIAITYISIGINAMKLLFLGHWPENEPNGNLTWNLYRVEQKPVDVDLRYIQPIVTGLVNVPGKKELIHKLDSSKTV